MRVDFTDKGRLRTLSSVVESRKFIVQEDAQRSVRVGCMIPFCCGHYHSVLGRHISRRGLTRVAYLWEWAMREPEHEGKWTVEAPTSFRI